MKRKTMKTERPRITKAHIDQLERKIMALVPEGKPYAASLRFYPRP
jgi:hypothetical protein